MGAWKANCFVCVKILLTFIRVLNLDYKCILIIGLSAQIFCYKIISMEEIKPVEKKRMSGFKKFVWLLAFVIIAALGIFIYWKYFFVFGEGVKSGHLNYAVKKGNIFKTYEGKLIQEGIRTKVPGQIQSYEFEFSIKDKRVFEILERNSGKLFDLHYREYHGIVPWRGNTIYIVDSILSMHEQ